MYHLHISGLKCPENSFFRDNVLPDCCDYRDRSETREYDYWSNGFLPGRDVYFTFDDNKGRLDIGPIVEILKSRVRPT